MSVSIKQKQNIPHGWSETEVIDVLEVNPEQTNPADSPDYFFQYIDISSVKEFLIHDIKIVTGASAPGRARRIVNVGDILISNVRPNLKGICRVPDYHVKTLCSTGFSVLRPKKIDAMFACQVFSQDIFTNYLVDKTTGSSYPAVNSADVAGYSFLLPNDIAEQQRIAEILGAVDEDIEKTKATIKATEKLKRGLMQELFTRGIGHTKFKQTELGEIPESWDVISVRNSSIQLIDGDRGVNYPKQNDFFSEGYCLFLCGKNVTKTGFLFNELSFITKEKDSAMRKGKLVRGDILLTSRGTVGNIAYYDSSIPFENIRINSGMLIIRHGEQFQPNFLYWYLNSPQMKSNFSQKGSGSAQPQLPIGSLELIYVPIVPKEEQDKIADILAVVDDKISINKKLLAKQTELKKGLMQDLLSGSKRVTV